MLKKQEWGGPECDSNSLRRPDTWGQGHSGDQPACAEGELSSKETLKACSLSE